MGSCLLYVISLYNRKNGSFSFSKFSEDTILSTDFAVSALHLLGEADFLKENSKKISEYLLGNKKADGLFVDSNFVVSDLVKGSHDEDYITFQFTFFTLIALDILGVRFKNLPFLEKYLDENNLREWFSGLSWDRFWYESNKIMFMMYFLTYSFNYGEEKLRKASKKGIDVCFEILNEKQDGNSGYWGTDMNGNDLRDGAFGSAHIFLFYDYFRKDIQYKEKIIDSTLSLHSRNGLAGTEEGGACEDYDLIEIYLRILKQCDYRKNEIVTMLEKMREVIKKSQRNDGGFPYRTYRFDGIRRHLKEKIFEKTYYTYSSWNKMRTPVYHSDMWGTYFRLLSLYAVESILEDREVKSYNLPGWGYLG